METLTFVGHVNNEGVVEIEGTTHLPSGTKVQVTVIDSDDTNTEHWGEKVIALLDSLDMSDWESMNMPDAEAWVREIRKSHAWDEA